MNLNREASEIFPKSASDKPQWSENDYCNIEFAESGIPEFV
jgi:hypothetical protein